MQVVCFPRSVQRVSSCCPHQFQIIIDAGSLLGKDSVKSDTLTDLQSFPGGFNLLVSCFGDIGGILGSCYITPLKTRKQTSQLVSVNFERVNRSCHKGDEQIERLALQPTRMTAFVRAEPNQSFQVCPPVKPLRGDQSEERRWPGLHLERGVEGWNFVNFIPFIFFILVDI